MSNRNLTEFIKALNQVWDGLRCVYCSELCAKPVTLSQCFHTICSTHYDSLQSCPKCNIKFNGKKWNDPTFEKSVAAAKELQKIFQPIAENMEQPNTSKAGNLDERKKKKTVETDENIDTTNKNKEETNSSRKKLNLSRNKKTRVLDVSNITEQSSYTIKLDKTLEKRNLKGETALHVACRLGKIDKVQELLSRGANVNTKDNAGWTPLHEVVQNGKLEIVRLLLQHNALINVPGPSNETPLHEAIRYKHENIVEELITHGADINARNSKGETPVHLAKGNMKQILDKASENIIQTQTCNISLISNLQSELDSEDIRVFCTSQFKTVVAKIKSLSKHHDNIHIESKFTRNVTHLIVDTDDNVCTPTLEILQAVINGIWILDTKWLMNSTEKHLEDFEKYEVCISHSDNKGPRNSRLNRYQQLPGLFDGCHFYFHNFNAKYEISKSLILTKAILSKLVTEAGGVALRRVPNPEAIPESEKLVPYHAMKDGKLAICSHYIIFKDFYQPMYNMKHLKALPVGWLIECLEKYELCEPDS